MREFGSAVTAAKRAEIVALVQAMFIKTEPKQALTGAKFALEDRPDAVVARSVELRGPEGGRLRIAVTEADARPPFEWLYEITSDVGEADYFKHYLVREGDIVLALRKVLTPIDDAEAELILADLATARSW